MKRVASIVRIAAVPVIAITAVLLAWKLGYFELDRRQRFFETVQRFRLLPWVVVWFAILYAVAVSLCLPAAILTLLSGAIFGRWVGAGVAWSGFMLGTAFAYEIAHRVARRPMTRLFGEHKLLRQLRNHDDVGTLLRLRVIPVAPLAVMGYVAGLADVSLHRLLIATAIGAIPTVAAYSYAGSALLRSMVSPDDASKRALWIAAAVTIVIVLISFVFGMRSRRRD